VSVKEEFNGNEEVTVKQHTLTDTKDTSNQMETVTKRTTADYTYSKNEFSVYFSIYFI